MLSWWVRWLVIASLGMLASIYAMETARVAALTPQFNTPAPLAKKPDKPAAGALAKASQMDKVVEALDRPR